MLVYAGIDEAGYGPMLGPLCVAASVFVLEDADPADGAPNLWRHLNRAVCRRRRDRRRRIAVDDSKKLKGPPGGRLHPLRHLERGVLAFAGVGEEGERVVPEEDDGLFARLGVTVPDRPWYASRTALPVGQDADELRIATSRLRRGLSAAGVTLGYLGCAVVDAEALNRGARQSGTKASVNFEAAVRLVDLVWRRWGEAHPRIIVDRHGGRTRYREELRIAFPEASIRIVAEEETVSRYRLERDGAPLTVSFVPESEARHLPVALASMTAKYVRELLMLRLNRFFCGHRPELKPTAGYVQDARRYLADIEPVIESLGLDRERLVRNV